MSAPSLNRDDPRYVLPVPLPPEFAAYETPVTLLGAGQPGKVGLMELTFARRQCITRLIDQYQRAPLQIFRPLYSDPDWPEMAVVMLMQNGGGMVQGDRYRIDLAAEEGAAVHLTTQAASKLYKCEQNYVTQVVNLTAGAGSVIEYMPDPTIPYCQARFFQRTTIQLDPTATVITGEILTPGRTAHGEHNAYDLYLAQLEATDPDGGLLVADTLRLAPSAGSLHGPALLGQYNVVGVYTVFTRAVPAASLTTALREALAAAGQPAATLRAGVSELPNEAGVTVRLLGKTSAAVEQARFVVWNATRHLLFGISAPVRRGA